MFPVPKSNAPLMKKIKNNSTVTEQQNWRDLPHDILLQISSLLSLADLLSLNEVCSSWRIAMKNRTRVAYPALVILAQPKEKHMEISDHGIDGNINDEFFFHCINEESKYKLKKRSWLVDQYSSQIIGSHLDGWVIFLYRATLQDSYHYREVYLVHMFREIKIKLPNAMMGTKKGLVKFIGRRITKATLSANGQNSQEPFIVAITSNYAIGDYAFSLFNNMHDTLALWRYGDSKWTCFGGESSHITEIAVCNNTIYALFRSGGSFGKYFIELWELKRNLYLPEKMLCIELPHGFRSVDGLHCLHVPSADEIFLVDSNFFSESRQKGCICKLDSREKQWIKVNSLNGRTLLGCFGNSVILSSPGYKANSIYLVKKEQEHITVSIYCFDDEREVYKLDETRSCMRDEYHHMLTIGLFLLST